ASRCRQPARPRGHIVVVWVTTTPAGPRLCGLAAVADRVFLIPVARRPLTAPRDARVGDDFVIWTNWDANRARQPAAIEGQDLARRRPFHVTTIPYGRFNPQLGPATAVSSDLVV